MRPPRPVGTGTHRNAVRSTGRSAAERGGNTRHRGRPGPGVSGMPNSRMASRPPGRSTRHSSRHPATGSATFLIPNAIVPASNAASANGRAMASPRARETRDARPLRRILSGRSTASRRRSPPRRRRAGRRRWPAASIARSAVPLQTSMTRSLAVRPSSRTARRRHRLSSPALSRWFSRSYRHAMASNMPAMRAGSFDVETLTRLSRGETAAARSRARSGSCRP